MASARKLPSGNWRVRVFDGKDRNGKEHFRSFTAPTKKQAEFLAAEYAAKKKYTANNMTVGQAIERYINSKDNILSPTTIQGYWKVRHQYLQSLMDIPIDKLTREQVQIAVNQQSLTHSAKTVINAHGLLAAALSMYNPDFVLKTTLPRKVKRLKRDLPTSEEVMRIVHGTPAELPVLLALCCCLRMSEVRGIRKSAVHGNMLSIERVIVTVDRQHVEKELPKTDASRRLEELPDFLRDMIMSQPTEYATTLTGKAIYSRFTRLMAKEGYKVTFHDLRHISASDMHSQGIPDKVAAERGGWSGTQTMQNVYQHSFSDDRKKADKIMNGRYSEMFQKIEGIGISPDTIPATTT